ncbi:carbonic anhydrase [Martensiomyces pterosporus]|nr:carbonic anhydrase [Martensiomyces pterosporus]
MARACTIMPSMIGAKFLVHNGKEYLPVQITEEMVGRKLGEFSHTRKSFTYRLTKNKMKLSSAIAFGAAIFSAMAGTSAACPDGEHGHNHHEKRIMASEVQPGNSTICQVIQNNKSWAADMQRKNPDYFTNLAKGQSPKILWIGCSDSRMAVDVLTQTNPGDIFIHRNIANRIPSEDLNALSVIEYAVKHLKVQHVVVAGHTGCGGIKAAMSNESVGILDHWLRPIKDLYIANEEEINSLPKDKRADRLGELNVIHGVRSVAKLPVVHEAWKAGQELYIHGWMLQLNTGLLKDLDVSVVGIDQVKKLYRLEQPEH